MLGTATCRLVVRQEPVLLYTVYEKNCSKYSICTCSMMEMEWIDWRVVINRMMVFMGACLVPK